MESTIREEWSSLRQSDALSARPYLETAAAAAPSNPLVHSGLAAAWSACSGADNRAQEEGKLAFDSSRPGWDAWNNWRSKAVTATSRTIGRAPLQVLSRHCSRCCRMIHWNTGCCWHRWRPAAARSRRARDGRPIAPPAGPVEGTIRESISRKHRRPADWPISRIPGGRLTQRPRRRNPQWREGSSMRGRVCWNQGLMQTLGLDGFADIARGGPPHLHGAWRSAPASLPAYRIEADALAATGSPAAARPLACRGSGNRKWDRQSA